MRRAFIGIVVFGTLAAASAGADVALGTHAVRGRVQSVTATALVIRRSPKDRAMRFVLDRSTDREGPIVIGDPVSIRYVTRGNELIATAVASESRGCRTHDP